MEALLLVQRAKKIAEGWNKSIYFSSKSPDSDYMNGKKISIHAEEMALKNADPKKLRGARLYVVRNSNGHFLNSMPCERCMSIINFCMKKHGLKVVYYSGGT
jgi:hypothetical protein